MNPRYQAFPKIVPAGQEACVSVRSLDAGWRLAADRTYPVRFFSKVNRTEDVRLEAAADGDGVLRAVLPFLSAGEYALDVCCDDDAGQPLTSQQLYAVPPELAHLTPYKGDLHMHTTASDGCDMPLAMAIRSREVGMDFIAVTDHDNYPPSCEAIQAAAAVGLNLLILPGEEVTVREIGGHILSLNASGWVGKARHGPDNDEQRAAILRDEIGARPLVAPLTAEQYSHAVWTVREIRRLGGLAILAHPFWKGTTHKYYPPRALVDQLLRDELCDGIELLGGTPSTEGNRLAIARYCDEAQRGRRLPVVGCSDAHGQEGSLGRYWTVAFAADLTAAAIGQAVADLRSVACQAPPGGDAAIYGPSALVEYAYFLHREFFPLHDRICFLQAQLHRRALLPGAAAPPDYTPAIAALQAELHGLYRSFWHPPAP